VNDKGNKVPLGPKTLERSLKNVNFPITTYVYARGYSTDGAYTTSKGYKVTSKYSSGDLEG
jgi:hypothetical protein